MRKSWDILCVQAVGKEWTTIHDISVRDRSIAWVIFGFLLACYLLTYTGIIQSSDGLAMFATSESIARRGQADMNQLLWIGNQPVSYTHLTLPTSDLV